MALKVNGVAFEIVGARAEEMIEADFVKSGRGCECGNVAADIVFEAIGANDHGERVPTNQTLDAALERLISGECGCSATGIVFA